ncbi:MAG: hypothetical protein ACD_45C00487G0004 [uncultured bacterium]|nr:MAG: hypothetical protein ACD_45C00487G0004 [uncultured bacterium]
MVEKNEQMIMSSRQKENLINRLFSHDIQSNNIDQSVTLFKKIIKSLSRDKRIKLPSIRHLDSIKKDQKQYRYAKEALRDIQDQLQFAFIGQQLIRQQHTLSKRSLFQPKVPPHTSLSKEKSRPLKKP